MENNFKQEIRQYFYLYGMLEKRIWNIIPYFIQIYCIRQIFKLRKNDMCGMIHLSYGGNKRDLDISAFKDSKIKLKISKLPSGYAGNFQDETQKLTINFNEFSKNYKDNGTNLYYTLEHELFHALQNYLIHMENKPDGFIDYIKYLKAYRDTNDVLISIFDINGYGNLHIKEIGICDFGNNYINKLSKIFYTLNISERDAFYEAKVKGERFVYEANHAGLGNFEKYDLYGILDEQLSEFKKHYECYKLSDSQIFTLIDKCFYHLRYNESPEDNLQAVVMYDIAWLSVLH